MIINYCNIALYVEFSYEEAEPATYDYPGSPDEATIESVKVNDVDIYDLLGAEQLYDIQELICKQMRD